MPGIKQTARPLDVSIDEADLPKPPREWLPSPDELLAMLADDLRQPLALLLKSLEPNGTGDSIDLSGTAQLLQDAEELLWLLRDYNDAAGTVESLDQLAYRFEQAVSRLSSQVGGLLTNARMSHLDIAHLKRSVVAVLGVVREAEKRRRPESSDEGV